MSSEENSLPPWAEAARKQAEENRLWIRRQNIYTRLVFSSICNLPGAGEFYYPFDRIERATGLPRDKVRVACRHLKRRGLLAYARGLWSESTGAPAGAGYGLSDAGYTLMELLRGEFAHSDGAAR